MLRPFDPSSSLRSLCAPRYSARAFPSYRFIPATGMPHPICHPDGHSFVARAERRPRREELDPLRPETSEPYLFAADLFNHGFFWEAQDIWEGCWRTREHDPLERFFRALILSAASQLKVCTGQIDGAISFGNRASLLMRLAGIESGNPRVLGVETEDLAQRLESYVAETCEIEPPLHRASRFPYLRIDAGLRKFA